MEGYFYLFFVQCYFYIYLQSSCNKSNMDDLCIQEVLKPPRERLVSWLARLYRHRLTTTTGGNLSFIDDDGSLYITPSGGDKAIVPPANVCVRKAGQDSFEGPLGPSMEWMLHTDTYKARKDCKAILHAHSMALIAFSLAEDNSSVSSRCFHSSNDSCDNQAGVPGEKSTKLLVGKSFIT